MGNVISSLLMYALQVAWYCQRLIDGDYRQNHGSRSKPIMGLDEIDLDVFLSKCRAYYLHKKKRNSEIKYAQRSETDRTKKKTVHSRLDTEDSEISSSPIIVNTKRGLHAPAYTYLSFDSEGFLSNTDRELASRRTDYNLLIMNGNDPNRVRSKSLKSPETRKNTNERKKSRLTRGERLKRKSYYRKKYNPRSGTEKTLETFNLRYEPSLAQKSSEVLQFDSIDSDSASRDEYLYIDNERVTLVGQRDEERDSDP